MTNQKTPAQGGATEAARLAADAFPHRNVYLEGAAYMAEERSRVPLREAFARGYLAALSAAASAHPADEHHDAEKREAESEDHAATVTGDREKLTARLGHGAEVVDWYSHECADTMREAADALAALVEVDKSELAGVINRALEAWEGEEASEVFVARAIADWLRGEGR